MASRILGMENRSGYQRTFRSGWNGHKKMMSRGSCHGGQDHEDRHDSMDHTPFR